ncbi:MAG: pentapeptide repeat-containing protein [Polyangiaceae bacterium]
MTRAALTRAALTRAALTRAALTRAALTRAALTRASLTRAALTRAAVPPGCSALRGATIHVAAVAYTSQQATGAAGTVGGHGALTARATARACPGGATAFEPATATTARPTSVAVRKRCLRSTTGDGPSQRHQRKPTQAPHAAQPSRSAAPGLIADERLEQTEAPRDEHQVEHTEQHEVVGKLV